ncbi:MAG TPA: TetR/AcrR family transcriptional regulator [Capillimicrobium sp.]|nr:TetR/AcrR family transcriptional regulator [Capillimicrobium sp.]
MAPSSRRQREREIVEATRALFDERGLQDAPVEEIARAVGINKALIYRHFASKEELFVLTATSYLEELSAALRAVDRSDEPRARLVACSDAFVRYCLDHPAFLDCSISLLRRPSEELVEIVSEGVLLRLTLSMAECLAVIEEILRDGHERGDFSVDDPAFTANLLWARALGALHLARFGVGVSRGEGGLPRFFAVSADRLRERLMIDTLAVVGARR